MSHRSLTARAVPMALQHAAVGVLLLGWGLGLGGSALVLCWPAVAFSLVGLAHLREDPRLFGKRDDGRRRLGSTLVLLPYLLLLWTTWHLMRLLERRPPWHEICPGLWLGRRVFARELPAGVAVVVDLTCEFAEPAAVRAGHSYRCLPTLDGAVPDEQAMRSLVARIAAEPRSVYLHCASGHGRSAMVAAAVLVARGAAAGAEAAEAWVKARRPAIRLRPAQRRLLQQLCEDRAMLLPPEFRETGGGPEGPIRPTRAVPAKG